MYWHIWWIVALVLFGITVVEALAVLFLRYKRKRILTPNRALILGTFVSASILFFPLYIKELADSVSVAAYIKAALVSVQHAIRLFAFDGDYMDIVDMVNGLDADVQMFYTFLGALFYLVAPMLTFGLILSFFKNILAYFRYVISFWKTTHVFSELNEKSLALAKSIDEKYNKKSNSKRGRYKLFRKALIVFTDVMYMEDEDSLEFLEEAKEIGAILFTKDLESIKYRNRIFSIRKVSFYLISEDEEEKTRHAESIIADYKDIPETELFLFSDNIESKCFLDSYIDDEKKGMRLKVVRVNDIRALVYHNLNDNGIKLFEDANLLSNGTREISAVIVGLGKYGMEIIKALLWYCQLPGYRIKITAIDEREDAASEFKVACPDIKFDEAVDAVGDMRYTVNIKKAKFGTEAFYSEIENIKDITCVFVCLGTDKQNITAASGIRNWLAKVNRFPDIETVVYDSSLKDRINVDFGKQKINMIGDLDSFYSVGTVINSKLILSGLEVHKRWDDGPGAENNFYMNDYNYCSSVASALHRKLRTNIISYSQNEKKEVVFPFYYSDDAQKETPLFGGNTSLLKKLLPQLNDNSSIKALSSKMKNFADCLYIKLAHLHYDKLTVQERKEVLADLQIHLKDKKIVAVVPMLADTSDYIEGYDAYIREIDSDPQKKKALRRIFDSIIAIKTKDEEDEARKREIILSMEYSALSDSDKAKVVEYVKQHINKINDGPRNMYEYFDYANCFAHIEHIRWNAYMRTEGFRCAIETNKKFKLHYDLVPVDLLTFADCIKDI